MKGKNVNRLFIRRFFITRLVRLFALAALQIVFNVSSAAEAVASPEAISSLAPTGLLRAAINLGNGVLAQRDAVSGELSGVSVVLARELGARLDVPVELITYLSAGMVFDAIDGDEWDIAFLAIEPEREEKVRFSQPYVYIDGTYLVRMDSSFGSIGDLDRDGVTIAVGRGAAYDLFLSRTLTKATLLRMPTSAAAIEQFTSGGADAAAGVRQALDDTARASSKLRVLQDRFMQIGQAIGVPDTRAPAGSTFVSSFVEEMKIEGQVRAALDASGQEGAVVPPPGKPPIF